VLSQSKQSPNADTRIILDGHLLGVYKRESLTGAGGLSIHRHRWRPNRRTRYQLTNRRNPRQSRHESLRRIWKATLFRSGLDPGLRNKKRW
jgi:hypothetical protein